ncbi:hypothetical protein Tco_0750938, partial [Tanacetum coccineum]
PRCKEIDEVGEVSIIWNPMCDCKTGLENGAKWLLIRVAGDVTGSRGDFVQRASRFRGVQLRGVVGCECQMVSLDLEFRSLLYEEQQEEDNSELLSLVITSFKKRRMETNTTSPGEPNVSSVMNPSGDKVVDIEDEIWSNDADKNSQIRTESYLVKVGGEHADDDKHYHSACENVESAWKDPSVHGTKQSFLNVVTKDKPNKKVNFRPLINKEKVDNSDFVLPMEAIVAAKNKFANSLVGYFVGKSIAFPLVKNYVTNTWGKFGFQRVIKDDDGFFFFKFTSQTGLEQVLEQGPCMIRNTPIILTKWSSNMSLTKDKVTKVPVWVKLHKVPVVAYYVDGLSLITTQVGKPIMLDAFTCEMCADPWGRLGFARALIEVSADKELKKEVIMVVPNEEGNGHSLEHICIEYEWKPPLCLDCHVFGHSSEQCQKKVIADVNKEVKEKEVTDDSFTIFSNWRKKGKNQGNNQNKQAEVSEAHVGEKSGTSPNELEPDPHSDDSEVEEMIMEPNTRTSNRKGASTPSVNVNYVYVCAILESHVNISSLSKVCSRVFRSWDWSSNAGLCDKGCRIIIGCNVDVVDLMVIAQSNQVVHVKVIHKTTRQVLFLSFIYAANLPTVRRFLWRNLEAHKYVVRGSPWALMGDFNVALNTKDYYFGSSIMCIDMVEFKDCVSKIEVMDINSSGIHYTWNQKPRGGGGVFKKLVRVLLFVMLSKNVNVNGHMMFKVVSKLKALKKPLCKLVYNYGNLHERVSKLRRELNEVQKALDANPEDPNLREEEAIYLQAFNDAKLDEERFLKQKAKIKWLDVGDSYSKYFHNSVKSRNQRCRVDIIRNENDEEFAGPNVAEAFVKHYECFLGTSMPCTDMNIEGMFQKKVSDQANANMVRPITNEEIKAAMFDIGDERAPGPDGFTSAFFKKA